MKRQQESQFRLMTYNIGGGTEDFRSALNSVIEVIKTVSPDILVVQEATEFQDAEGAWHSTLGQISQAIESGKHFHFGSTICMREHMHVQKPLFVHGIFNDWQDWQKGNAMLSRWQFVRLGDPSKAGVPRNVPLYVTPVYEGNRDTEPRHALLARVSKPPIFPFVVGVHLTTLVAEREEEGGPKPFPGRAEEAQLLRFEQSRRLIDLLREHVLEPEEVVFLLGDFNAMPSELCISSVLESQGGFARLTPTKGPRATHPEALEPIDHIFVHPCNRLVEYQCWIVDSPIARQASDHLPVVADVKVR